MDERSNGAKSRVRMGLFLSKRMTVLRGPRMLRRACRGAPIGQRSDRDEMVAGQWLSRGVQGWDGDAQRHVAWQRWRWQAVPMIHAPLALNRKLVDSLYVEAMLLADEARSYFDVNGRAERDALPPMQRVGFSCESLRVTTR